MEIFSIPGFDDRYWISQDGKVFNSSGKELKTTRTTSGYATCCTCVNGKKSSFLMHRVLAELFIPNPENKPCVNHIDGDKSNFDLSNLEWVTHSENTIHAQNTGLKHDLKPVILTPVIAGGEILEFNSTADAARFLGVNRGNISQVLKGKGKSCCGYIISYK